MRQASEWPQNLRALVLWQESSKKTCEDTRDGKRMEMRVKKRTSGNSLEG